MVLIQRYLLFFLLSVAFQAYAQLINPEFENYSTEQGLSQSHVFCITQDRTGFIWLGTDDGLNRFDGHDFRVFKTKEGDQKSIPDNSIRAFLVDGDSTLWIGTNNGVCKYEPKTESITRFKDGGAHTPVLQGIQVNSIARHVDNSIWITYIGDGVEVISPDGKSVIQYSTHSPAPYKIRDDLVSCVLFLPDGFKLIGTLAGMEVLNKNGEVLDRSEAKKKFPWIESIDNSIRALLLSSDGKFLWIATEMNGFYQVDMASQQINAFNRDNGKINFNYTTTLFEDSHGNIWIGSEELYFFDYKTRKLFRYNGMRVRGNKVIQNSIEYVFEDRDHDIWIGTYSAGVLKYSPGNKQVLHYFLEINGENYTNSQILSFSQATADKVWIGTDGEGLLEFDLTTEKFAFAAMNKNFSSKVIKCMLKNDDGSYWLGTWDGGFMKYHPQKGALEIFNPGRKNFNSIHVWDIAADSTGELWLATLRDGLCHFNPKTKKYRYFQNNPVDPTTLINNDVMTLTIDSRGVLWAGTSDGLSVLLPGKDTFVNFHNDSSKNSLSNNVINCLLEDNTGKMWIGTNGGGITVMDKSFNVIKVIKEKDGLPSNNVSSLVSDKTGNIWATTFKGVAKLNTQQFSIDLRPQAGYLQEKEFITDSYLRLSDGRLLFGSTNGFDMFNPDSLKFRRVHEQVVFTSLKIFNFEIDHDSVYNGRHILNKSITFADRIDLSYEDYSFTLAFAPLIYNWQKNLHYAYFMENLDEEWQYTSSERRFVHYSNLTPGEYTLKVKASFDGKTWPDRVTSLKITIHPPWWGTRAFKIATFAILIIVLFGIYKIRIAFLERQQKKLSALVESRTSELKRSYEELQQKNIKIEAQKEEIQALAEELSEQKKDIEQKNEELQAQHDILAVKSTDLEEAQRKLQDVNKNLEQLIDRRTNKLNTAVRELETFLYRASHDLRGPISSMLGLIRVAELENGRSDKIYIDFLRKTTLRLERTLAKLVQKHTIQKSKIQKETITKDVLIDLLNEIAIDIPHFRVNNFEVKIEEELMFDTDKPMLSILLSNLIENAFFFSQQAKNKIVSLDIHRQRDSIIISVQDFGSGIQSELKDKIFTMFFRGSELSTGNGLGLYLVQNALIRINGKITLDTEEGKFTRFMVTLDPL
jgi:ligand-binding sensor domain-containing protein/signal transduction histidine kinase